MKYSSSDFIRTHHPNHSSALKVFVQAPTFSSKLIQGYICSTQTKMCKFAPAVGAEWFHPWAFAAWCCWQMNRALLAAGCSLGAPVQNASWARSWLCLRVLQGRLSACKRSCTEFSTFLSYLRMNLLNPMQFRCGLRYTYSRPVPHESVFLTCSCYTHEERRCISSLFFCLFPSALSLTSFFRSRPCSTQTSRITLQLESKNQEKFKHLKHYFPQNTIQEVTTALQKKR